MIVLFDIAVWAFLMVVGYVFPFGYDGWFACFYGLVSVGVPSVRGVDDIQVSGQFL